MQVSLLYKDPMGYEISKLKGVCVCVLWICGCWEQSQQAEHLQDKSKKQMEMATWISAEIRING